VLIGLLVLVTAGGCGGHPTTPTPVPTPTPTPVVPPPPVEIYGCGLPRGKGLGRSCPRLNPAFDGEVDTAIQRVIDEHPDYFDFRRARGSPGSFRVRNGSAYTYDVVDNLRKMGLCALDDSGKEIAVKNDNSFSDQYQILSSEGFIVRGLASYRATCFPAWDAIPPAGDDS
jgi:hypothetical protein